jgi:hypothetical protein
MHNNASTPNQRVQCSFCQYETYTNSSSFLSSSINTFQNIFHTWTTRAFKAIQEVYECNYADVAESLFEESLVKFTALLDEWIGNADMIYMKLSGLNFIRALGLSTANYYVYECQLVVIRHMVKDVVSVISDKAQYESYYIRDQRRSFFQCAEKASLYAPHPQFSKFTMLHALASFLSRSCGTEIPDILEQTYCLAFVLRLLLWYPDAIQDNGVGGVNSKLCGSIVSIMGNINKFVDESESVDQEALNKVDTRVSRANHDVKANEGLLVKANEEDDAIRADEANKALTEAKSELALAQEAVDLCSKSIHASAVIRTAKATRLLKYLVAVFWIVKNKDKSENWPRVMRHFQQFLHFRQFHDSESEYSHYCSVSNESDIFFKREFIIVREASVFLNNRHLLLPQNRSFSQLRNEYITIRDIILSPLSNEQELRVNRLLQLATLSENNRDKVLLISNHRNVKDVHLSHLTRFIPGQRNLQSWFNSQIHGALIALVQENVDMEHRQNQRICRALFLDSLAVTDICRPTMQKTIKQYFSRLDMDLNTIEYISGIINIGNSHFQQFTLKLMPDVGLTLRDSLSANDTEKNSQFQNKLIRFFKHGISIVNEKGSTIEVKEVPVNQQSNLSDCGVHAFTHLLWTSFASEEQHCDIPVSMDALRRKFLWFLLLDNLPYGATATLTRTTAEIDEVLDTLELLIASSTSKDDVKQREDIENNDILVKSNSDDVIDDVVKQRGILENFSEDSDKKMENNNILVNSSAKQIATTTANSESRILYNAEYQQRCVSCASSVFTPFNTLQQCSGHCNSWIHKACLAIALPFEDINDDFTFVCHGCRLSEASQRVCKYCNISTPKSMLLKYSSGPKNEVILSHPICYNTSKATRCIANDSISLCPGCGSGDHRVIICCEIDCSHFAHPFCVCHYSDAQITGALSFFTNGSRVNTGTRYYCALHIEKLVVDIGNELMLSFVPTEHAVTQFIAKRSSAGGGAKILKNKLVKSQYLSNEASESSNEDKASSDSGDTKSDDEEEYDSNEDNFIASDDADDGGANDTTLHLRVNMLLESEGKPNKRRKSSSLGLGSGYKKHQFAQFHCLQNTDLSLPFTNQDVQQYLVHRDPDHRLAEQTLTTLIGKTNMTMHEPQRGLSVIQANARKTSDAIEQLLVTSDDEQVQPKKRKRKSKKK